LPWRLRADVGPVQSIRACAWLPVLLNRHSAWPRNAIDVRPDEASAVAVRAGEVRSAEVSVGEARVSPRAELAVRGHGDCLSKRYPSQTKVARAQPSAALAGYGGLAVLAAAKTADYESALGILRGSTNV
jgi:hypothetical protein